MVAVPITLREAHAFVAQLVALRHGRRYIGIELNPEYVAMSVRRIEADAPLFNRAEAAADGPQPTTSNQQGEQLCLP